MQKLLETRSEEEISEAVVMDSNTSIHTYAEMSDEEGEELIFHDFKSFAHERLPGKNYFLF